MIALRHLAVPLLLSALLLAPAAPASAAAPKSPVERVSSLVDEERFPEAERALRRILESRPGDTEAIYFLGRVYLETDRLSRAVDFLETMADRHEGSSRVHQGLGEAYAVAALQASVFRQLGLARDARSSLERAVRLDPRNLEARISLFEFYRHAPAVVGGGMDKARGQLEQIGRLSPSRGHEMRGHLLRDEGDEGGAIAAYRQALAADPSSARIRLSLILALIESRRFGEAFEVTDAILERDPDHMSALYQLGRNAALSGKRLDEGERALRRYLASKPLRNQPSHAWAHYRLGMIQKRRGEDATARYSLRRALSLDPELDGARKVLDELGS